MKTANRCPQATQLPTMVLELFGVGMTLTIPRLAMSR